MSRRERHEHSTQLPRGPACVVLVAATLLAACGGASGPQSASTAAAVRHDIGAALTSTDVAGCKLSYLTKRFTDQGTYAIPELLDSERRICRADVRTYAARSVKLTRIKVDGDHATVRMQADGGAYGYGTLDLALARDGTWKLDRLTAVRIDRAKFNRLQARFASVGEDKLTKAQIACSIRRLGRYSDAELDRATVQGDVGPQIDPLLVCLVRPALRKEGVPIALTSCVLKQLESMGRDFLRIIVKDDGKQTERLFTGAAQDCAQALTA